MRLLVASVYLTALLWSSSVLAQQASIYYHPDFLNSPFGPRYIPPGRTGTLFHRGLDFLKPEGAAVPPFSGGTLTKIILQNIDPMPEGGGNVVEITSPQGDVFKYLHLFRTPEIYNSTPNGNLVIHARATEVNGRFEVLRLMLGLPIPSTGSASGVELKPRNIIVERDASTVPKKPIRIYAAPNDIRAWNYTLARDPGRIPVELLAITPTSEISEGAPFSATGKTGTSGFHNHIAFKVGGVIDRSLSSLMFYVPSPPKFTMSLDGGLQSKSFYLTDFFDFKIGTLRPDRPKGLNVQVNWTGTTANLDGLRVQVPSANNLELANLVYNGSFSAPPRNGTQVTKELVKNGRTATNCVDIATPQIGDFVCPQNWVGGNTTAITNFAVGHELSELTSFGETLLLQLTGYAVRGQDTVQFVGLDIVRPKAQFAGSGTAVHPFSGCNPGTFRYSGKIAAFVRPDGKPAVRISDTEMRAISGPCQDVTSTGFRGDIVLSGNNGVYMGVHSVTYPCQGGCNTGTATLTVTIDGANTKEATLKGSVQYKIVNDDGYVAVSNATF